MVAPEKMNEYAGKVMQEILSERAPKIEKALAGEEGKKIQADFLESLNRLFEKCIKRQETGEKEAIRYVYLFILNASFLTETYEMQFNAFSQRAYLDKVECMELWVPKFFIDSFLADFAILDKRAEREIIRYNYQMKMTLKKMFYEVYLFFVQQYIHTMVRDVEKLESFQKMVKHDELQIIYSGYMAEGIQMWPQDKEQKK